MMSLRFTNFGKVEIVRVVSSFVNCGDEFLAVYCRNPYGGHNLLIVSSNDESRFYYSIRHGNRASLDFFSRFASKKSFRRVARFLAEHGHNLEEFVA